MLSWQEECTCYISALGHIWLTKPKLGNNAAECIALLMGLVAGPIKFIVEFPYKWLPLCCSFLHQLLTRPTSCTSQTEGMIFPEILVPMK